MNFLSPKEFRESKGALDESALKRVSLCPNLGSQITKSNRARQLSVGCSHARDEMISAAQLRAARGLLDWTRADLAKAANISPETVKNIEHGTFRPQENTAEAIIKAFAARDVLFTDDEGVKVFKNQVKTFIGKKGYNEYLDHIYSTLKDTGGKICQFNVSDRVLSFATDYCSVHLDRMSKVKNLDARVLVKEGDSIFPASYCSYRWLVKEHLATIPYYVYGPYVSMASFQDEDNIEVISIHSEFLAKKYLEHFETIWAQSPTPALKTE
jgi:DNA-binding XRE family transcriptional regulator